LSQAGKARLRQSRDRDSRANFAERMNRGKDNPAWRGAGIFRLRFFAIRHKYVYTLSGEAKRRATAAKRLPEDSAAGGSRLHCAPSNKKALFLQ
jgi:hypothetical protein